MTVRRPSRTTCSCARVTTRSRSQLSADAAGSSPTTRSSAARSGSRARTRDRRAETSFATTSGSAVGSRPALSDWGTNDHNLNSGQPGVGNLKGAPVFVGGRIPKSYSGYRLAPRSRGTFAGSDGGDMGIRFRCRRSRAAIEVGRESDSGEPEVRPSRRVLMLVENLSVPADRRVWQECLALRRAGYDVSVVCPRGDERDREPFDRLDGVDIHRYDLRAAQGGTLGYLREYVSACWHTRRLALRLHDRRGFDVVHASNPPDLLLPAVRTLKRRGCAFRLRPPRSRT